MPRLRPRGRATREEEAYFFKLSNYAGPPHQALRGTPRLHAAADPRQRDDQQLHQARACEDLCVSRTSLHVGHPGRPSTPSTSSTCGWTRCPTTSPRWATATTSITISKSTGPRTCTSSARRSCASTRSSGPPCSWRWTCRCPKRCSATAGCCSSGGKMSKSKGNVVDPVVLVRALRRRRHPLFPAARDSLRLGRHLLQRSAHHPHQRRPGQRSGQPCLPHGGDGGEVLRRHPARGAESRAGSTRSSSQSRAGLKDRYEAQMETATPSRTR